MKKKYKKEREEIEVFGSDYVLKYNQLNIIKREKMFRQHGFREDLNGQFLKVIISHEKLRFKAKSNGR